MGDIMKFRYFLLPVLIISIMIFVLDNDTIVVNKEIVSGTRNISYPFFDNDNVDNYISKYLNSYSDIDNLIIDYDYYHNTDNYYVTFYKYINNNNMIANDSDTFLININDSYVQKYDKKDILYQYDFINSRKWDNTKKLVAFTFDDGPNYNTSRVIDILNKYNVKATFFVVGRNIKGNEEVIKKMRDSDMEIGNHTFNHLLLTKYDEYKINSEIDDTSNLLFSVTGDEPNLFRPSYGVYNKNIKKLVDYPIITWNVDTLDWKYHNSKVITNRVINTVEDGDIILMHDIYRATANAIDNIIPLLKDMGYEIVTVSELFYYKGISLENGKVYSSVR